MSLNKVQLIGNLTRDPEIREIPNGTQVASFGLATNFTWTDSQGNRQTKAEFHNIVAWRKLAEICANYLRKGSKIYVEGRLQTREWEGQDGVKRQRVEIVANNMIMLDKKSTSSDFGGETAPAASETEPAAPQKSIDVSKRTHKAVSKSEPELPQEEVATASADEVNIEDLPF
ncbi:single-stranded DNA-binding protein [Candidatus Peregrinibacteria bacterium]|nr:single-stranded DNA-binding protein [Candidatus Peregrinibacteria bacterium]